MLNRRYIFIALVLACGTCGAMAQEKSLTDRRLDALVGSLDDESWVVREQSTGMLGDPNEGFELDMLAEVLERGNLTPETRVRLRAAARLLFGQTTKAGLGVGFGGVRDGGVEIGLVVQDVARFPAAGMLMPGDLIVGAEGKPLTTSEELRSMILSHEPGETLNLLVQRGDDVLDLDLPLGSYKLLTGAAPISTEIADRAIEIRWARRGVSIPGNSEIGGEISVEDWVGAGYPEEPGAFRASNARRSPRVVSLGAARDVFVGVGTMVRGRIEPWSNRINARSSMDQARRIELSRQMSVAKMQVRLMKHNIRSITDQVQNNPDNAALAVKLSEAGTQLRVAEEKLVEFSVEFNLLKSSP